jgi:hypothetical protein
MLAVHKIVQIRLYSHKVPVLSRLWEQISQEISTQVSDFFAKQVSPKIKLIS